MIHRDRAKLGHTTGVARHVCLANLNLVSRVSAFGQGEAGAATCRPVSAAVGAVFPAGIGFQPGDIDLAITGDAVSAITGISGKCCGKRLWGRRINNNCNVVPITKPRGRTGITGRILLPDPYIPPAVFAGRQRKGTAAAFLRTASSVCGVIPAGTVFQPGHIDLAVFSIEVAAAAAGIFSKGQRQCLRDDVIHRGAQREGGCRVARAIHARTGRRAQADIVFKVSVGRDHQGVLSGADHREISLGGVGYGEVIGVEPGDRFAEGNGVGNVTVCTVVGAGFAGVRVAGDRDCRSNGIDRCRRVRRDAAGRRHGVARRVCGRRDIKGHVGQFHVGIRHCVVQGVGRVAGPLAIGRCGQGVSGVSSNARGAALIHRL